MVDVRATVRRPRGGPWGDLWGWAVPPSNHRYLSECLPHSELDLVDAGHFTWEDAADPYAEIVIGW